MSETIETACLGTLHSSNRAHSKGKVKGNVKGKAYAFPVAFDGFGISASVRRNQLRLESFDFFLIFLNFLKVRERGSCEL